MNLRTVALKTAIGLGVAVGLVLLAPRAQAQEDATAMTRQSNASVARQLPFQDSEDFEDARRGLVATLPDATIRSADGRVVWSLKDYEFLKDEPPPTVNPSLWRVARLNLNHGLFKVAERIYQIRGFDISNMDVIEGDAGLIVIDPLVSAEFQPGLELSISAAPGAGCRLIYAHSHVDHYGGVEGVVSEDEVGSGKVTVLAPEGFLEEAVSENVFAGNAMGRRAIYMFGILLPKGERGHARRRPGQDHLGRHGHAHPADRPGQEDGRDAPIDGVEMTFQMAPRTEAPAEFLIHFPQFPAADATITFRRATLDRVLVGETTLDKEIEAGSIRIQGDRRKLAELLSLLDSFEPMFNIVTP